MSLQITLLMWFYFAIGFGFFLGGMCTAPPIGRETKCDMAGALFGSIFLWPALIIILLWEP